MKKTNLLSLLLLLFANLIFSQTKEDVVNIVGNYDLSKIKELQENLKKKTTLEKQKAESAAIANNWPIRVVGNDGSISELMKLTPDGFPIYYTNNNASAARSTRANHLNSGGSLGLDLNGQGMVARVWDGGTVRSSHNLFSGRVTIVDDPSSTTYAAHATHVTGTIMASNANANTKGMAYMAEARTFEWTDDNSEALSEVPLGMLISNHSYGVPITGSSGSILPAWYIGSYTQDAKDWDEIAYLSPYYLAVLSAGNDGLSNANPDPIAFGYDKLTGNKVSKNNMVVANAQDAVVAANGTLTSVAINTSSNQGPTDDNRIKPDITGNGTSVTSTNSTSDTSTTTMSGTSMASPNVAGTLLLLQQHYKNLTTSFMKASTLKGLACHTADDAGNIGPDPVFGWGLLNAKKAAETITGNGLSSWISEENLNQEQTTTFVVKASGTEPLIASICWTDVPGVANNGTLPANDPTKALVNDLDIRIRKNAVTYFPWKLNSITSSEAIQSEDNAVDNVEQVKIDSPTNSDYTITISHKGTLQTGKQNYSLVITGITSSFSIVPTSSDLTVCSNQNAVFTYSYKQNGTGNTTFSAIGLPTGATASFNNSSLSANGNVVMTISGLSNVIPGEYNIGIVGNNGTETETRYKTLKIYNSSFVTVTLSTPSNLQTGLSTSVNLTWGSQFNAESYKVQVSTDANFSTTIHNTTVTTNRYTARGLSQDTVYYWRVIPQNQCGTGLNSNATVYNFKTGVLVCGAAVFNATDFTNASIATVANSSASVPVTVTGGHTIGSMKVGLNLTHTYIQDMTISLVGPASIGSPEVILFKEACGDHDNIACTLDDNGEAPQCAGNPSVFGLIAPYEALSNFNNLVADGQWTLKIKDPYNGDGGRVNSFSIDICYITNSLGIDNNSLTNTSVYPNPTKDILNIDIPQAIGTSKLKLYDVQGRFVMETSTNITHEVINIENLQSGVYLLSIENENNKTVKKVILNK
ncbi:MAG: T9SS C-terminal target domain-containing protein [Flavobacteriaceae bacterium]|nr:T9SS C-terminal target domain-containing protein [Flavobacteriaceae bacterium]